MKLHEVQVTINHAIESFKLARFIAIFQAGEKGLLLPRYKGSTFRGALGHAFKNVTCTCHWNPVNSENHLPDCVYQYIFETKITEPTSKLNSSEGIPRPFIIEPPLEEKEEYLPGERFVLSFTLFGRGIDYFPYFISVLAEIGEQGLGKRKQKAELRQIFYENFNGDFFPIYNHQTREMESNFEVITGRKITDIHADTSKSIRIYYQTPFRMKNKERFLVQPDFQFIIRGLIRRLYSLLFVHHNYQTLEVDFSEYIRLANMIELVSNQTQWLDWERFSNRQQERLMFGGIVGKADYYGDWQIFYPLLKLGEWIHLGKSSVFGLGKIKVVPL